MSGILNSKTRVMDTIVTLQGRRQLAAGGLNIAYVSFSDATTFYSADEVSGSTDASSRLYLEACNLPQDMLTFTADDSGRLLPFTPSTGSWSPDYIMKSGQLLSGSGANGYTTVVGSTFASESERLCASSLQNFKNLYIIGSRDSLLEDDEGAAFGLSSTTVTFNVDDKVPLGDPARQSANINEMESLFNDPRCSRLPNFRFLPPLRSPPIESSVISQSSNGESYIESKLPRHRGTRPTFQWNNAFKKGNRKLTSIKRMSVGNLLGSYQPLGANRVLSDEAVNRDLQYFEKMGLRKDIDFVPRPLVNHMFCQAFEQKNGTLLKLDILDFGKVTMELGRSGDAYFIGKVVTDENGTNTFLHIFTMIFESYTPSLMRFSRLRSTTSHSGFRSASKSTTSTVLSRR